MARVICIASYDLVAANASVCKDEDGFNCARVDELVHICLDVQAARLSCQRYCGLCNIGEWNKLPKRLATSVGHLAIQSFNYSIIQSVSKSAIESGQPVT